MAYLRKESEKVEISYPSGQVWSAVQKVLANLGWNAEYIDETTGRIKARTRAGPMSFSSMLLIEVTSAGENTTRLTVESETPVTTITAIVDFRQGKRRILQFLGKLSEQLTPSLEKEPK